VKHVGRVLGLSAVLAAAAPAAQGQELPSAPASSGWSFGVAPYLWASGMKGDVATLPPAPPAKVDADFEDILENMDIALMGIAEIRKDRFGILADLIYLKLTADGETPGGFFSGVDLDLETFVGTFEGSYRAVESDLGHLDLLAGVRVWSVTTELALGAGLLPAQQREDSETWVDPVIGAQGRLHLGSGFYLTGMGNVGGFGVASELTWDVFAGLGYQASDWFAPVIGYRHLEVDYEKGSFLFDVEMSGPVIGGVLRF
jgi:hypothetical protein